MIVVDVNVLLYAVDEDSTRHREAKAWLETDIMSINAIIDPAPRKPLIMQPPVRRSRWVGVIARIIKWIVRSQNAHLRREASTI